MFIMWLGERITDKGIGNGISLIIMIGIIARLPFALFGEFVSRMERKAVAWSTLSLKLRSLCLSSWSTILLVQGTRQNTCAICQEDRREQTIWWRPAIYSIESECCRCYADHLCTGHHVPAPNNSGIRQFRSIDRLLPGIYRFLTASGIILRFSS